MKKIKLGNKTFAFDHAKENLLIASTREAKRNNKKNFPFEYGNASKGQAVSTFVKIGYTCLVAVRLESSETFQFLVTHNTNVNAIKDFEEIIKKAKSLIPINKPEKPEKIETMEDLINYLHLSEEKEIEEKIQEEQKKYDEFVSSLDLNKEEDVKIQEAEHKKLEYKKLLFNQIKSLKNLIDGGEGDIITIGETQHFVPSEVFEAFNNQAIKIKKLESEVSK